MDFLDPLGQLVFEFSGRTQERSPSNSNDKRDLLDYDLAERMNQRSSEMAERIRRDLKRMLPPGLEVTVEIDYFAGSLEWAGVVMLLDWAARIADNISLIEYIQRAIRFSINRVHRLELRRFPPDISNLQVDTEVRAVRFPEGPARSSVYGPLRSSRQPGYPAEIRVLMYLNTLLLLGILIILLRGVI